MVKDAHPPASDRALRTELRRSRDLLRAVFDNLSEGILLLDRQGQILAANQIICRLAGRRPQDLVGKPYSALWAALEKHGGLRAALNGPGIGPRAALDDLRSSERFQPARASWQIHLRGPDALDRWFTVERIPIQRDTDRRLLERWSNITEQAELQRRLLGNEQLISLGRLAAGIAHEVGNPLQSTMSCLELCFEGGPLPPRVEEYLDLAIGELERMGRTLESLRTLYRPPQVTWERLDLNELLRLMQRLTRQQLARQQITMRLEIDDDLPPVYGQPDSLRQVLLNLILNAQEAIGERGEIIAASRYCPDDHSCRVSVRDSGPGLSAEQLARLFEPFSSGKARGAGLGLYLSKQIIDQHGGQITVESPPYQGAEVSISLPAHDPDEPICEQAPLARLAP